jgi:hypothetical protein
MSAGELGLPGGSAFTAGGVNAVAGDGSLVLRSSKAVHEDSPPVAR